MPPRIRDPELEQRFTFDVTDEDLAKAAEGGRLYIGVKCNTTKCRYERDVLFPIAPSTKDALLAHAEKHDPNRKPEMAPPGTRRGARP